MFAATLLTASLMAMAPQWAVVDLPYPDVSATETAAPLIDPLITEAVTNYARAKVPGKLAAKPGISNLKVENDTASLRLTLGDRVETVVLVRKNREWRVVQALAEAREY